MLENAVNIGDPISSGGCCSSRILSASVRRAGSLKSHGFPAELVVVRSSATPGTIPSLGFLTAVAVILGAENISETIALSPLVDYRRNFLPLWPSEVTRAIMSLYLVLASARSSRLKTAMASRRSRLSCRSTRSKSISPASVSCPCESAVAGWPCKSTVAECPCGSAVAEVTVVCSAVDVCVVVMSSTGLNGSQMEMGGTASVALSLALIPPALKQGYLLLVVVCSPKGVGFLSP